MKDRIRILQLQPFFNVKSVDISDLAEQIVKSFPASRFEITSAYLAGRPKSGATESAADSVHYFDFKEEDLKGMRLGAMHAIYQHCRKNDYDVVICNRFKMVSIMLQLNKILRIPLCIGISHVMDEYHRLYRRMQVRLLSDKRWRFVGVSDAVRECLINYNCGFTPHNTVAITNAIDTQKAQTFQLDRNSARLALNLPTDPIIIGAIGRLVPTKGHEFLIRAFAEIAPDFSNVQLAIIGDGKIREKLTRLISERNLNGRIHLLGFRENALQYVRAFDIYAMPSLSEGLGLALLEGMTGGLPIIASDIPAMRPLILGAGGIAVPPKDIGAIKAAMITYLNMSDEERAELGKKSLEYVSRNHSIAEYRSKFLSLVEQHFE